MMAVGSFVHLRTADLLGKPRHLVSPLLGRVSFLCSCKEKAPKESTPGRPARCAGALRFSDLSGVHRQAIHGLTMDARHPCLRPATPAFSVKSCDARPATRDPVRADVADHESPLVPPMRTGFRGKRPLACLSDAQRREFKGPRETRAQQGSWRAAPTGTSGVVSFAYFSCRYKKSESPSEGRNLRPRCTSQSGKANFTELPFRHQGSLQ